MNKGVVRMALFLMDFILEVILEELAKMKKKHLFLVPKGSLVWYGFENYETGCFGGVSDQIIYLGRNNWFNRLYYKWVYKAIIL